MCENQENSDNPAIICAETLYVSPNVVFHLGVRMSETWGAGVAFKLTAGLIPFS